jgi:digeranylgeranylglycerophospholipid reductase
MASYDIAIAGGGPAGLSAAYAAAQAGAKVILLEKEDSIAHSIRTSGVTWIDEIEKFGIHSDHYNPIRNYSFLSKSNQALIRGVSPKACVLNVRTAFQHLAMKAAEAGSEIMVRSKVTDVIRSSSDGRIAGLKVKTPKGELEISCKVVIDATGFISYIARRLGIVSEWKSYGVGAEYECYCENLDLESWVLMVGTEYSDGGYAWVFPVSNNRARIGVGVARPYSSTTNPLQKLNYIIDKRLRPIDEMGKIQPIELHYGYVPNDGPRTSITYDGLLLVGDSAGQVNPLVLEGIRFAMEYGRLAGKIAAKCLQLNSCKDDFREYDRAWKETNHGKMLSGLKVQRRWLRMSDNEWDREIEILKGMSVEEFLDFIKAEFYRFNPDLIPFAGLWKYYRKLKNAFS